MSNLNSNLKAPKRPRTINNEAVRHIPRDGYQRVPIDAISRYLYKYSFDHFCLKFVIKYKNNEGKYSSFNFDGETIKQLAITQKDHISSINELINTLYNITIENTPDDQIFVGLPIISGGVICHYSDNINDPNHTCTIILGDLGSATDNTVNHGNRSVHYVGQ